MNVALIGFSYFFELLRERFQIHLSPVGPLLLSQPEDSVRHAEKCHGDKREADSEEDDLGHPDGLLGQVVLLSCLILVVEGGGRQSAPIVLQAVVGVVESFGARGCGFFQDVDGVALLNIELHAQYVVPCADHPFTTIYLSQAGGDEEAEEQRQTGREVGPEKGRLFLVWRWHGGDDVLSWA